MHLGESVHQVIDYLVRRHNSTVQFWASDMVMNIHLNASYLSKPNARGIACGYFFMGSLPMDR
jgi:hypothetical protein